MKKSVWVLCALTALCASGTTAFAEEEFVEDEYIEGEYSDIESIDDVFVDYPIPEEVPSLSQEHLTILDRLGDLLDYSPSQDDDFESVSMNDFVDSVFDDSSNDAPGASEYFDDSIGILSSIDSSLSTLSDVALYSDFTAFNGAISSTYLDLFRGFLPKLSYKQHYVLYRESQYVYSFVYGTELSLLGSRFTGSNLTRVFFDASNSGRFGNTHESSFSLNAGSGVVYTDLGGYYPALSTDIGSQLVQIKWVLFVTVLSCWMISLYKGFRKRGDRDKRWSSVNTV